MYWIKYSRRILSIGILFVTPLLGANAQSYRAVEARKNATDTVWRSYTAKTLDRLPNFKFKKEPTLNSYGSWKTNRQEATGFFRVQQIDGRWWFIDPEGYPFIHKGVVAFSAGTSDVQKQAFQDLFGTKENWAEKHIAFLKSYGFNGVGAWSDCDEIRQLEEPLVYTVIVSPMSRFKSEHRKALGGKYLHHGWQGYRFDLPMVFDPQFDQYVEESVASIVKYKDDKYLLGYFTDNELPWVNNALDRHLTLLAKDEYGYVAAKEWLEKRKNGFCGVEDITDEDRNEFLAYMLETYLQKVVKAIRKYDPNHLYLGCRFNQEREELQNEAMFRVAGKYMDVISVNHYRKWEPVESILRDWSEWSGRPFIITEWYTKGEDTPLPNRTGAGWNVKTQKDRGHFYQNFCIELMRCKNCIGWHWFKYQDNDPEDLSTDISNRDSNKGIVDSKYRSYTDLLDQMKILNSNVLNLIKWYDKQ